MSPGRWAPQSCLPASAHQGDFQMTEVGASVPASAADRVGVKEHPVPFLRGRGSPHGETPCSHGSP